MLNKHNERQMLFLMWLLSSVNDVLMLFQEPAIFHGGLICISYSCKNHGWLIHNTNKYKSKRKPINPLVSPPDLYKFKWQEIKTKAVEIYSQQDDRIS